MDQNAIPPSQRLDPVRWPAERLQPWPRAKIAIGWNVAVIVVGALIAVIGLINGLAADPENSALRQTVAALWVIQGLFGMLIAVVGILGATLVHGLLTCEPLAYATKA
jgi:hypothetical protein